MIQTPIRNHIFRLSLICLLILTPAALAAWILNVRGNFPLIIIYVVITQIVSFLSGRRQEGAWQKYSSSILFILLFFGGIALIIYIIIIPFSAYQIWFALLDTGKMRGVISWVFVLFLTYSSCLVFINVYRTSLITSLLLYGSVLCFTFFMIYRFQLLLFLFFMMLFTSTLTSFSRNNLSTGKKRGFIVLLMLLLLSSGLTAVFSLLPEAQGSAFVGGRLAPGLRRAVLRVFPKFPVLAGIPGYGISMPVKNLNAKPTLSEYPLFELDMEPGSWHYLRTVIYDTYNGKGWDNSTQPSEKVSGINFLLPTDHPSDMDQRIKIKVVCDFYPYIPHTLRTSLISGTPPLDIEFGDINTGYAPAVPLLFDQELVLYETGENSFDTSAVLTPEMQDVYLSVPKEIDSSIVYLGGKFASGDLADRLSAIGDYLSDGFIYDLEVPSIQGDRDILSKFLFENKRGYCVHFATSSVILARIAGMPARYATGFLVNSSGSYEYLIEEEKTEVTGLNAHAWAEIWVPGKGWITWETTPPMIPENQRSSGFWENLISGESAFTRRQVEAITGILPDAEDAKFPLMGMIGILLAAFTSAGIAIVSIFPVKRRPGTAQPGGRLFKQTRRLGRRITRHTGEFGISHPGESGWTRWERETGKILSSETSMFREIFFAHQNPGKPEIKKMKKLLRALRKVKKQ